MNAFTDYEFLLPLSTGPIRITVTNDASRSLDSIMDRQSRPNDEMQLLLFATSADLSHDEHVDPHVVVDNLIGDARKFFKVEPTADMLTQFREGLHEWICEHRGKLVSPLDA